MGLYYDDLAIRVARRLLGAVKSPRTPEAAKAPLLVAAIAVTLSVGVVRESIANCGRSFDSEGSGRNGTDDGV